MLEEPRLLEAHPHRVFVIAQLRDLPELARKAALRTLNYPVSPHVLEFPELELIPAAGLQRLSNFHHRCGEEAQRIAGDHAASIDTNHFPHHDHDTSGLYIVRNLDRRDMLVWWKQTAPDFHSTDCGGGYNSWNSNSESVEVNATEWFQKHSKRLAAEVRVIPTRETVEREALRVTAAERAIVDGCDACTEHADRDLKNFASQLAAHIESANQKLAQELW